MLVLIRQRGNPRAHATALHSHIARVATQLGCAFSSHIAACWVGGWFVYCCRNSYGRHDASIVAYPLRLLYGCSWPCKLASASSTSSSSSVCRLRCSPATADNSNQRIGYRPVCNGDDRLVHSSKLSAIGQAWCTPVDEQRSRTVMRDSAWATPRYAPARKSARRASATIPAQPAWSKHGIDTSTARDERAGRWDRGTAAYDCTEVQPRTTLWCAARPATSEQGDGQKRNCPGAAWLVPTVVRVSVGAGAARDEQAGQRTEAPPPEIARVQPITSLW